MTPTKNSTKRSATIKTTIKRTSRAVTLPTFESRGQRLRALRLSKSVIEVPLLTKPNATHKRFAEVQDFLKRFGYLDGKLARGTLDKPTSKAVHSYQKFHGLVATGLFDVATRDHMARSRCGMPDQPKGSPIAFNALCAWDQCEITFAFDRAPAFVDAERAFNAVRRAIATWDKAVPLRSREVGLDEDPDVVIGWRPAADPDHDMTGSVLAHADFPPDCSVVATNPSPLHFDDEEHPWGIGGDDNFDIETVALHEWGHILGLGHSSNSDAVMAPTIGEGEIQRTLHDDDIDGVASLYPGYTRLGDSGNAAGEIRANAAIRFRTDQIITAVRTASDTLKLIAWQVPGAGPILRTGDSGGQAGTSYEVDIASGSRVVVACRTASGTLKLISWDVNDSGTSINRAGDSGNQAGAATLIRIVALSDTLFVTGCCTASGTLLLISWRLNVDGTLTRLHDSGGAAGQIGDLSLAVLGDSRVASSVRTASGNLKVIVWDVASNGVLTRVGDSGSQAGTASMIASCLDENGNLVTAVRAGNGDLVLIAWAISSGGAVSRLGDSHGQAGETNEQALMPRPGGVVAAVRTQSGILRLIGFDIAPSGEIVRGRDSNDLAGSARLIRLTQKSLEGSRPIVTAVKTGGNNLKLIAWVEATCF